MTDGCGSLADIAGATVDTLIDCTLEPQTAETVVKFFSEQDFIPWIVHFYIYKNTVLYVHTY